MDNEHLLAAIESLDREEAEAERRLDEAEQNIAVAHGRKTEALRWLEQIRGAKKTLEELSDHSRPPRIMSAQERLIEVLRQSQAPLGTEEISRRMLLGGWPTDSTKPISIVRVLLVKLTADGLIVRPQRGLYTIPKTSSAPTKAGALESVSDQGGN